MKLTKREKILLIILVIVLGGYLYFRFVYIPQNEILKSLREQYVIKEKVLQQVNNRESRLKYIDSRLLQLESKMAPNKDKISSPVRLPEILAEINQAAGDNKVVIDNISFTGDLSAIKGNLIEKPKTQDLSRQVKSILDSSKDPTSAVSPDLSMEQQKQNAELKENQESPSRPLSSLSASFNFTGSYDGLMNLIRYFEDNKRYYLIDILEIHSSGDILTGILGVRTFTIHDSEKDFKYDTGNNIWRANPFK